MALTGRILIAAALAATVSLAGWLVHSHLSRPNPTPLDGFSAAWFVVAAATPPVNRRVAEAAAERRLFANVVDEADTATAYTAGVLRRGGATIAVSTEGRAPALAGLLREALEAVLPEQLETWVAHADRLRRRQRSEGVAMVHRRPLLLQALNEIYD